MIRKLKDTTKLMESDNYKERFVAEYHQLKIRITKLENFIARYYDGTLDCTPSCSMRILKKQLRVMKKYKQILEQRALIEEVVL